ncbi:MAG: rhodanese-like domain-containing protein [Steroidobacteraceae bacterium]
MRLPPLIVLALSVAFAAQAGGDAPIEPRALGERLAWGDRSLVVLDVRTPAEYQEGHLPGAINIPHTEIAARVAELADAKSKDVVVYCRSGNRSRQALDTLGGAGFRRLFHLEGDYQRWSGEHRQVIRPQ